jgi:hypothetical protein
MVGRSFAGTLLVVIGVALLLINLTGVGGVAVVLLGGLAFLATYVATRSYGFLVPGGILTGFGAALVAQDLGVVADIGLIGLGVGFLLIPAVQLMTGTPREGGWWWPLIPGGILVALGVIEHLQGDAAGLILPAVLIILGLAFLLSATRREPVLPDGPDEAAGDASGDLPSGSSAASGTTPGPGPAPRPVRSGAEDASGGPEGSAAR